VTESIQRIKEIIAELEYRGWDSLMFVELLRDLEKLKEMYEKEGN